MTRRQPIEIITQYIFIAFGMQIALNNGTFGRSVEDSWHFGSGSYPSLFPSWRGLRESMEGRMKIIEKIEITLLLLLVGFTGGYAYRMTQIEPSIKQRMAWISMKQKEIIKDFTILEVRIGILESRGKRGRKL